MFALQTFYVEMSGPNPRRWQTSFQNPVWKLSVTENRASRLTNQWTSRGRLVPFEFFSGIKTFYKWSKLFLVLDYSHLFVLKLCRQNAIYGKEMLQFLMVNALTNIYLEYTETNNFAVKFRFWPISVCEICSKLIPDILSSCRSQSVIRDNKHVYN